MVERGVVTKVKGKRATVSFDRRSACDSCHMCAVTKDGMKVEIVVENTLGANVGDFVTVEMGEKFVLTAATIVYVLPLVLVGAGIGIGTLISELAQIIMAVGGLVVGFAIAFLLDRFVIRKRKGFSPQMKEITTGEAEIKEN
ncbi:MAG: SoxR reducing system RseC family protein [Clostridia bacterium]|nr:SoxR reducing system RseC family protein [Clostridia bacterium]